MLSEYLGKVQKHGPLVHGPPAWTRSTEWAIKMWTGFGFMDPLFLLPLKIILSIIIK